MQHGVAAELLACTPMLSGLGAELLSAIILRGDTVRFSAGQPVTLAGIPADSALYILEGRVALPEQVAEDITPSLEPGAAISEMAMFVEMDHYHNTVALEDVVALQISRELMGHLVFERPVLTECFAANIRNNLAKIANQLMELDSMLEETSLPEPQADNVAEEFEFPPPPAVISEHAGVTRDDHFSQLQLPELSMNGLEGSGLEETGPYLTELGANLSETVGMEEAEGVPVRDIMAELSRFSLPLDQTPPAPAHDQRAFPSLAPPQSREVIRPNF